MCYLRQKITAHTKTLKIKPKLENEKKIKRMFSFLKNIHPVRYSKRFKNQIFFQSVKLKKKKYRTCQELLFQTSIHKTT